MVSATDRWDWTADASVSPTRLGDHAASRYRRFRRVMEAVERVDGTSFGMLLAVESARDELRPFEEVTWLVRLAGTRDELRQVQHLHRVLDAAVTQLPEEEGGGKWVDVLFDERDARVKWYQQWLEAGDFEDEITLEPRQEEVLTLLKAAIEAYDPDSATEILMPDEAAVMQLAFEKVTWSTNVLMLSTPDWLVSPLAVGSSFGFSRWGSQRLILKHDDPDPSASVVMAAAVWSRLNHPHVVKFLGACHVGERTFVIHEIVQPLVQNLKDRKESIPRANLWRLIHEIALALHYIHQSGFAVKILTPDVLCLAPYQDRALLKCMNAVPLDSEEAPLNTEAFATCIVDLWRELDTSEQGVGTLADPKRIRRIGNCGEFPVECPDFFMESEWKVLKQLYNSCTDVEFRDVIESLSSLANLTNCERLFAKRHIDPRSPYTSKSWQSFSSAEGNSKLKSTAASLLNSTGGEQREMPSWTISADTVQLGEKIGRGSFAAVYTGKWFDSPVVVKCLRSRGGILSDEERKTFHREADIWFSLSHINVVQMFGAYEFEGSCHFVCAYANEGTLDKYLASEDRSKAYSSELKKFITAVDRTDVWGRLLESALGLQYLHRAGIVHGDLKLNNILVGSGLSKLTDFGLSLRARDDNSSRGGAVGAYQWKAPECISFSGKSGSPATFASDVYSFAMCIVEAVTGEPPWKQVTSVDEVAKYHIMRGKALPRPADMQDAEWELIKQMTDSEPERRLTMDSVVAHLYAKVVGQSLDQLYSSESKVYMDANHVLARPHALLALSSLVKSNNRSITINCGNLLSMMQCYRYYSPAEQQEISAVITLLQDERSDVVEWAATAVGHLASLSKANRAMIRDEGGVSQIVRLLKKSYASSPYQTDVALYAMQKLATDPDIIAETVREGIITPLCKLILREREHMNGNGRNLSESAVGVLANLMTVETCRRKIPCDSILPCLMAMLRKGTKRGKRNAAAALTYMTSSGDHCNAIVNAGVIPTVIRLLTEESSDLRKAAAGVLVNVSAIAKFEVVVAESGAIPPLVNMLKMNGSKRAALVLANVAANGENEWIRDRIAKAGAIPLLAQMLQHGTSGMKTSAMVALIVLMTSPARRGDKSLEECIPILVSLLKHGSEIQQDSAVSVLQNLSVSAKYEVAIAASGAIHPLLRLVSNGNDVQKENSAATLGNLAHNADCKIEISKAGGIPQLTALLICGTEPQKEKAARALRNLSLNAANGAAFGGSGSIDALASLVRNGSNFLRDEGTKTLIALSQYADTAQIIADRCIPLLTELLRDDSAEQRKSAVDVLYHLSARDKYYSALSLALKPLLGLVHSDSQREAVGTVANLARNAEGARVITENGGIQLLTTLLRDEPLSDKISVLVALVNLTVTMPNDTAEGIVLGGTIPLLVQLMERGSERDFARRIIQCVLEVCASPDATGMTETIPSLVSLTNDKNPHVRELAMAGLANLTSFGDAVHATRVAEAGGIGALSALLREKASSRELSNAVAVVVNLSTRLELKPALRDYGVVGLLLRIRECGEQSVAQSLAILAWQNLAENYMNSATVVMMDSRDYKYFKYSYSWEVRKPE